VTEGSGTDRVAVARRPGASAGEPPSGAISRLRPAATTTPVTNASTGLAAAPQARP